MKRLLTPKPNSCLSVNGYSLSGGRDFILVPVIDSYTNMLVLQQRLDVLATGDKPILLPDSANYLTLLEIVKDKENTTPWDSTKETYVEYKQNVLRFAAEAYTAELNGENPDQEAAPKTTKAKPKPAVQPETE